MPRTRFLATLSHELRTPLNAALGWTHILRDCPRQNHRHGRVQAIYRNLQLQSRIVSDILDISRITKGELPLEPENVDMRAVFEAAVDMVREAANARGVTVDIHSVGRRPYAATPTASAGGVEPAVERRQVHAERGAVTVSIPSGPSGRVLGRRRRARHCAVLPAARLRTVPSGGFVVHASMAGWAWDWRFSQHIVECHQGTIVAANRPKGGAVFAVQLPRAATFPAPSEAPRPRFHPTAGV